MMFRKDEGFTLVELMVVVLIIGILVAVAVPVFNAARATAEERSCFSNQRTLDGAAQTWAADDTTNLLANLNAVQTLVDGGFVRVAPTCPEDNSAYTITAGVVDPCANHGSYLD